jgi:hypothetical protein
MTGLVAVRCGTRLGNPLDLILTPWCLSEMRLAFAIVGMSRLSVFSSSQVVQSTCALERLLVPPRAQGIM